MKLIRMLLCMFFLFEPAYLLAEDNIEAPVAAQEAVGPTVLNLADCVVLVLAENPTLGMARTDIDEKAATLSVAKKDLLPTLSLQYGYTRQQDANMTSSLENYYNYAVTLTQPVYRGGALMTAVELGRKGLKYSEIELIKALNNTVYQVYGAYFNVLKAEKLNEVAEQALTRLESHLRDARAFYEAGLIPKNDLLTTEVQLAQGQQDLLAAQNNLAIARTTINLLMNRPVDQALALVDLVDYEPREQSWDDSIELARSSRPEIILANISMEQAEKNVDLAKAAYLPSLNLSARYLKQGDTPGVDTYPLGDSEVKQAQATLTWQFWSWGQNSDRTAVARHRFRKSKDAQAQIMDSVTLDVRRAWVNLRQVEKNIDVTRQAVEQAEENYRINEARYKAQLNTSTEVLDAQTLLSRARSNYYNALYDYKIAEMSLDWATGALGNRYIDQPGS